jgi:hypothetical protein
LLKRIFLGLALACLVCLTSGCGGPALIPVSGKVMLVRGNQTVPLPGGSINFRPDKSKGNTFGGEPVAEINAQGEYTLETKGKPGAPAGAYKVIVTAPVSMDNTKLNANKITVSTIYLDAATTPLNAEVSDKPAPGAYDFKVAP